MNYWEELVAKKEKFIGGVLEETSGDYFDAALGLKKSNGTVIEDMEYEIMTDGYGKKHGAFHVYGKDYSCGFNTNYGYVIPGKEGWITFSGYGGHEWRIKEKES